MDVKISQEANDAINKKILEFARMHTSEDGLDYLVVPTHWIEGYLNSITEDECETRLPDKSLAYTVLELCECIGCVAFRKQIAKRKIEEFRNDNRYFGYSPIGYYRWDKENDELVSFEDWLDKEGE